MYISFFEHLGKGAVLLCCIACNAMLYAQPNSIGAERLDVEYRNNRLSLDAVNATYESIFNRIAKKAGLSATLHGDLSDRTTIAYTDVDAGYLLHRLTREGYALIMVVKKDASKQVQNRVIAFDVYGPEADNANKAKAPPRVVEVVSNIELTEKAATEDSLQVDRLAGMGDVETINQLNDILQQSRDPDARKDAIKVLAEIAHKQALSAIEQGLSDADESVRITALDALAEKGIQDIDLILGQVMFGDQSIVLRQRAVEILGSRGTEAAQAFLMAAMEDPDKLVRASATRLYKLQESTQTD